MVIPSACQRDSEMRLQVEEIGIDLGKEALLSLFAMNVGASCKPQEEKYSCIAPAGCLLKLAGFVFQYLTCSRRLWGP